MIPRVYYKYWEEYPEFCSSTGVPHSRPMMLYLIAKKEYYAGKPIMSDQTFDNFENAIKENFPDCPALETVGGTIWRRR